MDRRYYLAKLGIVIAALVLALVGAGMGAGHAHMVHAASHYSAPEEMQAAVWHTTKTAGRVLACLLSRGLEALL